MEIYFSVQHDPIITAPGYYNPLLIDVSSDLSAFMHSTHQYVPTPLPTGITPVLFMYQVELWHFDRLIISKLGPDGVPKKGGPVTPIGVKSAGSSIYLSDLHRTHYREEMARNHIILQAKDLDPPIRFTWGRFLMASSFSSMDRERITKLMGHPPRRKGERPSKPGLSSGL